MRSPQFLLLLFVGLSVVLTACDNFAAYTVVNRTDVELTTWPFFEDCSAVIRNKADYLHEETVEPFGRLHYSDVHGETRDPKCVQVVTSDRQLVLAEPYEYGDTYVVNQPLRTFGDPIPERHDLPSQSLGELLRETPPAALVLWSIGLIFGLGCTVAFLFVVFITVRFFYRHYMGSATK